MLFGKKEMREFSTNHHDERVKSMMRKIEELTSKVARQHETILKLENNTYYSKQFEDLPITTLGRNQINHDTYQITINQITIKELLDIWDIDDINEDSEMAQVLRHLRAAVVEIQILKDQLDTIEARGKANAQERIALIQENMDLKKLRRNEK